jgi:hypothetical protein
MPRSHWSRSQRVLRDVVVRPDGSGADNRQRWRQNTSTTRGREVTAPDLPALATAGAWQIRNAILYQWKPVARDRSWRRPKGARTWR